MLLCGGTSLDLVLAYVGALRLGLTVVPANPGLSPIELATLVEVSRPALAVVDEPESVSDLAVPVADMTVSGRSTVDGIRLDGAAPGATALIIYTSGTTGQPKGVPLTHANLLASAHAVRLAWRWTPDDDLALACRCSTCTGSASACTAP